MVLKRNILSKASIFNKKTLFVGSFAPFFKKKHSYAPKVKTDSLKDPLFKPSLKKMIAFQLEFLDTLTLPKTIY